MADLNLLSSISAFGISQVKEWGEILTGFEQKNKYEVFDQFGKKVFYAVEVGGSTMGRLFLKALRAFEIHILDSGGNIFLKVKRPFKFLFHECFIYDNKDKLLGTVKWEFALIRKKYIVNDEFGNEICRLAAPALKPWTFGITKGGLEIGTLRKKWSGFVKEAVTDADNFGIQFNETVNPNLKAVLLGAVFLIDFVHFENKGN